MRFRDRLTRVEVELMALEITNLRFLDRMRRTGQPPGADVSMLKIKGTEIQQALTELTMQAADPAAQRDAGARAALPRHAQDHDLRRLERDPAQHHRQDDVGPMNFDYNEEQQLLADSVRRFLQKDYDFEARKKILASAEGWSERVWATFAEMGLTGLPLSPDYGGFGGGAVDLMSVMEAFGEALVVEPYLPTRAWCARSLPGVEMKSRSRRSCRWWRRERCGSRWRSGERGVIGRADGGQGGSGSRERESSSANRDKW